MSRYHYTTIAEKNRQAQKSGNLGAWKWQTMATYKKAGNLQAVRINMYHTATTTRRLNKTDYVYLPTGEYRQYKQGQTRTQTGSLRRTFARLRDLIRCNFNNPAADLWITLTYAANITNPQTVAHDWDIFYKRLRRAVPRPFKYLAVLEPQERGAWHIHLLLAAEDGQPLYIADNTIRALWRQGITQTQRLKSADDVGEYYSTYFTDLYGSDHKRQKAARLPMYPPNFKFYRCSQNLTRPVMQDMPTIAALQKLGEPTNTNIILLKDTEDNGTPKIVNAYLYIINARGRKKLRTRSCCVNCNMLGLCCETCNNKDKIVKIINIRR